MVEDRFVNYIRRNLVNVGDVTITVSREELIDPETNERFPGYVVGMEQLKDYVIVADTQLSLTDLFLTLAHEMRHIEQSVNGKLREGDEPFEGFIWDNEYYRWSDVGQNAPHEIDARIFESQALQLAIKSGIIIV